MRNERTTSRREFLTTSLVGAVGFNAVQNLPSLESARSIEHPAKSRIAIAYDSLLRGPVPDAHGTAAIRHDSETLDSDRVSNLLDQAMQGLFDFADPGRIWEKLVRPGQLIGVKVNTLGGRGLSSNVQLVEAICAHLQEAGIGPQDIVIWDRDSTELERAGFRIRTGGSQVQCFGTDRVGFEADLVTFGSVGSQLSRILTQRCDVLINVPVLKDHDGAGVSIALKNMYGVIHNPNKYHPNGCDPYVADVNMLQELRAKLRLHICDATTACFDGGPAFKPEFTWRPNALIVSEDPVALDQIGWQMIERKRAEQGLKALAAEDRAPRYIATAADAEHRLGNNDQRRIVVIEKHVA
jgi:uncharacterized protein (DUF362 family)